MWELMMREDDPSSGDDDPNIDSSVDVVGEDYFANNDLGCCSESGVFISMKPPENSDETNRGTGQLWDPNQGKMTGRDDRNLGILAGVAR